MVSKRIRIRNTGYGSFFNTALLLPRSRSHHPNVEGDDDYDEDGGDDDNTLSGAGTFISVLGIRDILVRIRILGSVPLTNGS
jgi:hypothetical protein